MPCPADAQSTPGYVKRELYLSQRDGARPKVKKRSIGPQTIAPFSRENPNSDLVFTTHVFAGASGVLEECSAFGFSDADVREFLFGAFSNRCETAEALNRVSEFINLYVEFSKAQEPPSPFVGPGCLITITMWLKSLRERGRTIPNQGRRALAATSDVLRLNSPL